MPNSIKALIPNDSSLFIRRTCRGCTILLLYVDDMIISGNDEIGITELKNHLLSTFKMKDLGHLTYFLGLEISRSDAGIRINQCKYAVYLLSFARLTDAKSFDTLLERNVRISQDAGPPFSDPSLFRRLVGNLHYLTLTRLEISHAIHTC